jgi:hypothetical protein
LLMVRFCLSVQAFIVAKRTRTQLNFITFISGPPANFCQSSCSFSFPLKNAMGYYSNFAQYTTTTRFEREILLAN